MIRIEDQNIILKTLSPFASKIALFGSYARGDARNESDVDILIQLNTRMGLLKFVGLKQELENQLNKKVDLMTFNSLESSNELLKSYIMNDLKFLKDE